MNLVGVVVKHGIFGMGTVIAMEGDRITVAFAEADKKFVYPDAFDSFLKFTDEKLIKEIQEVLEKKKSLPPNPLIEEYPVARVSVRNNARVPRPNKLHQIAFKCNYCDGGATEDSFGYKGVCSDQIIYNNIIVQKRAWCTDRVCPCFLYLNDEMSRSELDSYMEDGGYACYESQMLRDWTAYAGMNQKGETRGTPRKLRGVGANSLAVLTTRLPESQESDRLIFAVFLIDESYEGNDVEEGLVTTGSKFRMSLSPAEAEKMRFWDYHANKNNPTKPRWGTGLYRHLDEFVAARVLKDIATLSVGTAREGLATEFLNHYCGFYGIDIQNISVADGALTRHSEDNGLE